VNYSKIHISQITVDTAHVAKPAPREKLLDDEDEYFVPNTQCNPPLGQLNVLKDDVLKENAATEVAYPNAIEHLTTLSYHNRKKTSLNHLMMKRMVSVPAEVILMIMEALLMTSLPRSVILIPSPIPAPAATTLIPRRDPSISRSLPIPKSQRSPRSLRAKNPRKSLLLRLSPRRQIRKYRLL
jgi:hypothetical protein